MIIFKEFTFDAAHALTQLPATHKCHNLHGHTYRLRIFIKGPLDESVGWIMDFRCLKKSVTDVLHQIDHQYLNNIPGLENPTCEKLAKWIWNRLVPELPFLYRIELWETPTSGVMYEGD